MLFYIDIWIRRERNANLSEGEIMVFMLFFKYFFSLGVISGLLNVFTIHRKFKKYYKDENVGLEANDDKSKIIKGVVTYRILPFLILQIFQFLGGYKSCFYIFSFDYHNIFYIMGFASLVVFGLLAIYFIVMKDGAELIVKYRKTFNLRTSNKNFVKVFIILGFLWMVLGLLFMNKITHGEFSNFDLNFK
jgi:hypothetical protein